MNLLSAVLLFQLHRFLKVSVDVSCSKCDIGKTALDFFCLCGRFFGMCSLKYSFCQRKLKHLKYCKQFILYYTYNFYIYCLCCLIIRCSGKPLVKFLYLQTSRSCQCAFHTKEMLLLSVLISEGKLSGNNFMSALPRCLNC